MYKNLLIFILLLFPSFIFAQNLDRANIGLATGILGSGSDPNFTVQANFIGLSPTTIDSIVANPTDAIGWDMYVIYNIGQTNLVKLNIDSFTNNSGRLTLYTTNTTNVSMMFFPSGTGIICETNDDGTIPDHYNAPPELRTYIQNYNLKVKENVVGSVSQTDTISSNTSGLAVNKFIYLSKQDAQWRLAHNRVDTTLASHIIVEDLGSNEYVIQSGGIYRWENHGFDLGYAYSLDTLGNAIRTSIPNGQYDQWIFNTVDSNKIELKIGAGFLVGSTDVGDAYTLIGVTEGDTDMSTYNEDIISDNGTIKENIQELETEIKSKVTYFIDRDSIPNSDFEIGDRLIDKLTGAQYLVQADSVANFVTDGYFVIQMADGNYAINSDYKVVANNKTSSIAFAKESDKILLINDTLDFTGETINFENLQVEFNETGYIIADSLISTGAFIIARPKQIFNSDIEIRGNWENTVSYIEWTSGTNGSPTENWKGLCNAVEIGEVDLIKEYTVEPNNPQTYTVNENKNIVLASSSGKGKIIDDDGLGSNVWFTSDTGVESIQLDNVKLDGDFILFRTLYSVDAKFQTDLLKIHNNCEFTGKFKFIQIEGSHANQTLEEYSTNTVKNLVIKDSYFDSCATIFSAQGNIIERASISGNTITNMQNSFILLFGQASGGALPTTYQSIKDSLSKVIIFDNNIFDANGAAPDNGSLYHTPLLNTANQILFTNNIIRNLYQDDVASGNQGMYAFYNAANKPFIAKNNIFENIISRRLLGGGVTTMIKGKNSSKFSFEDNEVTITVEGLQRANYPMVGNDPSTIPSDSIHLSWITFDANAITSPDSYVKIKGNTFNTPVLAKQADIPHANIIIENNDFNIGYIIDPSQDMGLFDLELQDAPTSFENLGKFKFNNNNIRIDSSAIDRFWIARHIPENPYRFSIVDFSNNDIQSNQPDLYIRFSPPTTNSLIIEQNKGNNLPIELAYFTFVDDGTMYDRSYINISDDKAYGFKYLPATGGVTDGSRYFPVGSQSTIVIFNGRANESASQMTKNGPVGLTFDVKSEKENGEIRVDQFKVFMSDSTFYFFDETLGDVDSVYLNNPSGATNVYLLPNSGYDPEYRIRMIGISNGIFDIRLQSISNYRSFDLNYTLEYLTVDGNNNTFAPNWIKKLTEKDILISEVSNIKIDIDTINANLTEPQFVNRTDIPNLKYPVGTRLIENSTGAQYLVQADSVAGFENDSYVVIEMSDGNYAKYSPAKNTLTASDFGITNDTSIDYQNLFRKSFKYAQIEKLKYLVDVDFKVRIDSLGDNFDNPNAGGVWEFLQIDSSNLQIEGLNKNTIYVEPTYIPSTSTQNQTPFIAFMSSASNVEGLIIKNVRIQLLETQTQIDTTFDQYNYFFFGRSLPIRTTLENVDIINFPNVSGFLSESIDGNSYSYTNVKNCKFVYGGSNHDYALYLDGGSIVENSTFEVEKKYSSHAIYCGLQRPNLSVLNNTFLYISGNPTGETYAPGAGRTGTVISYRGESGGENKGLLFSGNKIINSGNLLIGFSAGGEYYNTIINNNEFRNSEGVDIFYSRNFTVSNNVFENTPMDIYQNNQDGIISGNQMGFLGFPTNYDTTVTTIKITSNNIDSILQVGGVDMEVSGNTTNNLVYLGGSNISIVGNTIDSVLQVQGRTNAAGGNSRMLIVSNNTFKNQLNNPVDYSGQGFVDTAFFTNNVFLVSPDFQYREDPKVSFNLKNLIWENNIFTSPAIGRTQAQGVPASDSVGYTNNKRFVSTQLAGLTGANQRIPTHYSGHIRLSSFFPNQLQLTNQYPNKYFQFKIEGSNDIPLVNDAGTDTICIMRIGQTWDVWINSEKEISASLISYSDAENNIINIVPILGANAPSSPSEGDIVMVSDTATSPFTTAGIYFYLSGTWKLLSETAKITTYESFTPLTYNGIDTLPDDTLTTAFIITEAFSGTLSEIEIKTLKSTGSAIEWELLSWNPDTDTFTSIVTDSWVTGQKSSVTPISVNFNTTEGHALLLVCDKPPVIPTPDVTNQVQVQLKFNK